METASINANVEQNQKTSPLAQIAPIGQPEDLCLWHFNKESIIIALEDAIKASKNEIEKIKDTPEGKLPSFVTKENLIRIQERLISDNRTVLERVEATPTCE